MFAMILNLTIRGNIVGVCRASLSELQKIREFCKQEASHQPSRVMWALTGN